MSKIKNYLLEIEEEEEGELDLENQSFHYKI